MPEAMALNAGATEALGPHASHWPGLLFVSPAPLCWQLTEASLALRGECALKKRAGLGSQEAHA